MLQLAQPTMDFKFVRNPKRTCSTRNGGFVCVCLFVSVCVRVCWICFYGASKWQSSNIASSLGVATYLALGGLSGGGSWWTLGLRLDELNKAH
jgi:uncharacterized membrane protein